MSQGTLTHAYAYARKLRKLDTFVIYRSKKERRERERTNVPLGLNLLHEPNAQVFQHDAVEAAKKAKTCGMKSTSHPR